MKKKGSYDFDMFRKLRLIHVLLLIAAIWRKKGTSGAEKVVHSTHMLLSPFRYHFFFALKAFAECYFAKKCLIEQKVKGIFFPVQRYNKESSFFRCKTDAAEKRQQDGGGILLSCHHKHMFCHVHVKPSPFFPSFLRRGLN